MSFLSAMKKELVGMRYDLKKEAGYYCQDMAALWTKNNGLFDYVVRGPWMTLLLVPTHILGFFLAGIGYYSRIERAQ